MEKQTGLPSFKKSVWVLLAGSHSHAASLTCNNPLLSVRECRLKPAPVKLNGAETCERPRRDSFSFSAFCWAFEQDTWLQQLVLLDSVSLFPWINQHKKKTLSKRSEAVEHLQGACFSRCPPHHHNTTHLLAAASHTSQSFSTIQLSFDVTQLHPKKTEKRKELTELVIVTHWWSWTRLNNQTSCLNPAWIQWRMKSNAETVWQYSKLFCIFDKPLKTNQLNVKIKPHLIL